MSRTERRGPLLVGVAVLRKHPGTTKRVKLAARVDELEVIDSRVRDGSEVEVDVLIESVLGGVVVSGSVSADWEGACRRCLEPATGRLVANVRELYCDDADPELNYSMTADWLDLEPLAHDACILELPLAPLCGPDCLGLCPECGANRNHETCSCAEKTDPRWAALSGARYASSHTRVERMTMAVPKKKTSKSKSRSRRASAWTLNEPSGSVCPQCNRAKLPHVVCPHCGWYKGRQAIEVD